MKADIRARSAPASHVIPSSEAVIVLGWELRSRKLYALRQAAFRRGVHVLGAIGAGKTSLLLRYLYAIGLRLPWVLHDFIGNGHRHLETWVANLATLLATAECQCPELGGSTARFLSRFAFLSIGDPNPAVRVDLLRRRTLPGGARETVRDVTGRALEVFFAKLNDPDAAQRVRFRRIATALLACLIAGERPITEALFVFDDPAYMSFLEREITSRRLRRSDHRFLAHQLAELHHVLALRPTDPTKSWRAFEDMTESTRNSMSDFAPGTLLGELFGEETFPLEQVAFGRTSLSVTTRHADDTLKSQAFQALHSLLHSLFLHRQDMPGALPLTYILDEPRWVRRNFPGILAVSRNLGVSYVIAHQSLSQWEDIGLLTMSKQLRALTNMQIAFRPTSFADAEDEMLHTHPIQPDGLVQLLTASRWERGAFASSSALRSGWEDVFTVGAHGRASRSLLREQDVTNVVGFQDQMRYLAQAALWRPRFTGTVTLDGIGTEVAFAPAPEFPAILADVPILDLYRAWHSRHWWSRIAERRAYEPWGTVVISSSHGGPRDEEEPLAASATHPSQSAPRDPVENTPRADTASSRPIETATGASEPAPRPVTPPAFPKLTAEHARGPKSRRRHRGQRGSGGAA